MHADEFERRFGGYPLSVDSELDFRTHTVTASRVRNSLHDRGINLPESWLPFKNDTFIRAASTRVRTEIDQQWQRHIRAELGQDLQPNLSYDRFITSPAVQARIRDSMGTYYVAGVRPDYDREQFYRYVVTSLIDREARALVAKLEAQTPAFVDGGNYEEVGKQALRQLVVPPIAMAFSLFFGLVALIKLPLTSYTLARSLHREEPVSAPALARAAFLAVTVALILITPFLILDNKFSAADSGFRVLLDDARNNHPVLGGATEWIIRIQPVVYPLGDHVRVLRPLLGGQPSSVASSSARTGDKPGWLQWAADFFL